jgi:hypothetical protein
MEIKDARQAVDWAVDRTEAAAEISQLRNDSVAALEQLEVMENA